MLIGLSGYARSGKDTVAAILVEQYGFTRIAFAAPLKAIAADLDPWAMSHPGGSIRLSDLLHWYDDDLDLDDKLTAGWEYAKRYPEIRRLLQNLGVACREHLDPDVWVMAAMRKAEHYDRVVISDVRFQNEAKAIRLVGGEVWRINRPGVDAVNGHISEHDLDGWRFDRHVDNGGTLFDLSVTVRARVRDMALSNAYDVVVDPASVAMLPEPAERTVGELRRAS